MHNAAEPAWYVVMPLSALGVYGIICLIWGFVASLNSMGSLAERYCNHKRNMGPNNLVDDVAEAIVEMLSDGDKRSDWMTATSETGGGAFGCDRAEFIYRADKKVKISDYNRPDWIKLEIIGTGTFRAKEMKPLTAEALSAACVAFKQYIAVTRVLRPELFTDTEEKPEA